MSNLSRRSLVAGTAMLPALAVPTLAAAPNADAELLNLIEQAHKAWDGISAACDQLEIAESAMHEWKRRNPKPRLDEPAWQVDWRLPRRLADGGFEEGDTNESFVARLREAVGVSEVRARAWGEREQTAERNARLPEAHSLEVAANDIFSDLVDLITAMPATTMAGMQAKGRLSLRTEHGNMSTPIARSLASDIATGEARS